MTSRLATWISGPNELSTSSCATLAMSWALATGKTGAFFLRVRSVFAQPATPLLSAAIISFSNFPPGPASVMAAAA